MVAYNFKTEFTSVIEAGGKAQTIRSPRKGRSRHAKGGERIQIYLNMRRPECRKIIEDPLCQVVLDIDIAYGVAGGKVFPNIAIDGHTLSTNEIEALALTDGFPTVKKFLEFFEPKMPCVGYKLIYWGETPWRKLEYIPEELRTPEEPMTGPKILKAEALDRLSLLTVDLSEASEQAEGLLRKALRTASAAVGRALEELKGGAVDG